MELDQSSAERRIREFELEKRRGSGGDIKDAPKRKLEEGNCYFVESWPSFLNYVNIAIFLSNHSYVKLYRKYWNCGICK
jgi:hypothetical protein